MRNFHSLRGSNELPSDESQRRIWPLSQKDYYSNAEKKAFENSNKIINLKSNIHN